MTEKPKIQMIMESAISMAELMLKKKVEGVSSLTREGEDWTAEVEVLERKALPDTQDIISRYEFKLNAQGELTGYRRIALRHRGDMERVEEEV
jgi:hypothetical protein